MAIVALKLFLAPACVVAVSLAARRWGTTAAGLLGGFPVVAGPILLVITLQHGRDFGAEAAAGMLLGMVATGLSAVAYARLAPRLKPVPTLLASWTTFLAGVALLGLFEPPLAVSFLAVAATFEIGRLLVPAPPGAEPVVLHAPPWWDLPARALAALAMVLTITVAAESLGPELSGLLTPFPVLMSVLLVFTHLHHGAAETQVLIRGFLLGFYGLATFALVLSLTLQDMDVAPAFLLACLAAAVVQLAMSRRAHAEPALNEPGSGD